MVAGWFSPSERQLRSLQFDERIQAHFDAIQQLHTERNALLPICCLPPEVLAEIYTYVIPTIRHVPRDLLTITHVCHHWREVALAHPHLWSNINMDRRNPNRIRALMLERAKNAPLALELSNNMYDELQPAIFEELSQHIHRTCALSLDIRGVQTLDIPTNVYHLVLDAPILEHFRFWLHGSPETHTSVLLPEDSLVNATRMRGLSLWGCAIPWGSTVYKGLTRLELFYLYEFSPTAGELWAVLRGSPALEDIKFCSIFEKFNFVPESWNLGLNVKNVIELPKIHHISVGDTSFASYVHFFTNVRIPSHAHFDLDVNIGEEGLPNGLTMFPPTVLASIRADAEHDYTISLNIIDQRGEFCVYRGRSRFRQICDHRLGATCTSGRRITAIIEGSANHFHSLCYDPPLPPIHTLIIHMLFSSYEVPSNTWSTILSSLPRLQSLYVEVNRSSYLSLVDALMPRAEQVPASTLINMDLASPMVSKDFSSGDIQWLIDALDRRSEAGYRMESLTCTDIPVAPAELERLKQLVQDVTVQERPDSREQSLKSRASFEEDNEGNEEGDESSEEDNEESEWDEESNEDEDEDESSEEDEE
ncbi:hypothetical protein CONPUDRAFT_144420 [Coniophora puteana RWD-64-598 SS2]|uniref:F-box domain-containing protein n=1 Tax=Coniophora puteana (strain RWD-64-598) TaxID=741705 RepID=A0A5M3MNA3_CONPW|nr:uncharacterized protein CONPUDRAFT_144420 [Coniophora puteana RWD-64-598 SS2]EIW80254.1 hypothetical protein CONPUDRAFT_144420 [Coniophora puteana RWD-64-598 SS2]